MKKYVFLFVVAVVVIFSFGFFSGYTAGECEQPRTTRDTISFRNEKPH